MSVTEIGEDAFRVKELINVIIPNTVTAIGKGAFYRDYI
jgi:putative transposon-encoded protein